MKHYDKLIFVSESDTATSPMAEAVLQKQLMLEDILIQSKGLVVLFPEPVNPKAEAILAGNSLSMKEHQSEQLLEEDFDERTLVLTMNSSEKEKLLAHYQHPQNVFVLREYIQGENEIYDPLGGVLADYGRLFEKIRADVERLGEILKAEEAD